MSDKVYRIRPDNYRVEVISESKPVLLLCMPRGESFRTQMMLIEDIATHYSNEIKVGLIEETYIDTFKGNLNIRGTPTYLLMVKGEEKNRLIGLTDKEALEAFIFPTTIT